jgi:hypothetical protein
MNTKTTEIMATGTSNIALSAGLLKNSRTVRKSFCTSIALPICFFSRPSNMAL